MGWLPLLVPPGGQYLVHGAFVYTISFNSSVQLMNLPKFAVDNISALSIGKVLERVRLFDLLHKDLPTNVFWIIGPDGSGKTTLAAGSLKSEQRFFTGRLSDLCRYESKGDRSMLPFPRST
jgi:hypothetical protein